MNPHDHPLSPQQEYDQAESYFRHAWLAKRGLMESDLTRPDRDDLRRLYAEAREIDPELKLLKALSQR